ncbi:MAG: glycosyltransferase family 4 protein [Geminicoccaceae bacterium]|nr:glycosyltransferase family 4 protein [Geminicoccaceae bacterium]MCX7629485.1 glycosyltransferase family 4 protein [Geminicoccaceae bacterium]
MRIAMVYPHAAIGPSGEGVGDALAVVLVELGRRLLARGHQVALFIRRLPGEPARSVFEGLAIRRVDQLLDLALFRLRVLDRLRSAPEHPLRVTALYYPFFARQVAQEVAEGGFDLVHLHNNACFLPVFRRLAAAADLVLHQHDHALADYAPETTRRRLALARLVLACSDHLRAEIETRFPELAGRCATLYNGVDDRFFAVESDPGASRTILFVGRLAPEKGVDLLIAAFDRIADRHPDAELVLAGPVEPGSAQFVDPFARDPEIAPIRPFLDRPRAWREHLSRLAARRPGRIRFAGPKLHRELPPLLARAGIFAFPAVWHEPFGMPPIEAMAAGLPVVATRAGALVETVEDGRTGLLVERGRVEPLAEALDRLLARPELRRAMGAAGRQRMFERFRWEKVADRLVPLYERFCPRAARGAALAFPAAG